MMSLLRTLNRFKRNRPQRFEMMRSGLGGLRDRMRPARNMMFGGNRQLNPFFNFNLPRKNMLLPPSIAEAEGRNMGNVGLLPDYMQPGGSGMPPVDLPTDEPISRSDIMPKQPINL